MRFTNIKVYQKFLLQNKLYTIVSVFGFSVSLMFIIILGAYIKQELSVDNFQEKKDRIFLATNDIHANFSAPVADLIQDNIPEVEMFCRIGLSKKSSGNQTQKVLANVLWTDSTFFNMFSFELKEGYRSKVLENSQSVIVSESFGNKIFGNDNPIGKTLLVDSKEYTITGIIKNFPSNTLFPDADIILNFRALGQYISSWGTCNFHIFFLEKEGTDITTKEETVKKLFFDNNFWLYKGGFVKEFKFTPLKEAYFLPNTKLKNNSYTLISIYTIIVILILAISTLNYINLTVAQSGFRGKETAIKKLLGCRRSNIIRQILSESFLMMIITFIIGLALALISEQYFNQTLNTKLELSAQFTISVIGCVILFILLLAFISGIIPAIVLSGFNPIEVVKGSFSRKLKTSYSKILIIFQYAVVITLLICSYLIKHQTDYFINYDMGFNRDRIMVMNNVLDTTQLSGFKDKLYAIPGVEKVSYSEGAPIVAWNNNSFERDGEQFSFQALVVDSAFFDIYGITVTPTGLAEDINSYYINQKGFNALQIDTKTYTISKAWDNDIHIGGIISKFNLQSLQNEEDLIYMRRIKKNETPWNISVKISDGADLFATADKVKKTYSEYNGGEAFESQFIDDILQSKYLSEKRLSAVMSAFTFLTIVIMIMGVFAMSLYMIKQKEKEIGIRKVNGATENEILIMLNKSTLFRVLISFVIACPVAYYAMSKWLESFAYKISIDWWVFAGSGITVTFISLLSVSWLTWKAARENPVDSLKS